MKLLLQIVLVKEMNNMLSVLITLYTYIRYDYLIFHMDYGVRYILIIGVNSRSLQGEN